MKLRSLYLLTATGALAWLILAAPQSTSGQYAQPVQPVAQPPTTGLFPRPTAAPQATSYTAAKPTDSEMSPQFQNLAMEVLAQNKAIAANQAKIDDKLAKLAEVVHQSRLFAARAGGRGGAK